MRCTAAILAVMQVSFAPIAFIAEAMSKRKRESSASQLVVTQTGPAGDSLQQKDDMELLLAVAARKLGITTAGVDITEIRQQLHQQFEAGLAEEQPLVSPADVHDLQQQVARLQTQVLRQQEEIDVLRGKGGARGAHEFVVAQYNILAGYLGDNTQPWFLYGLDLSSERREAIFKKFYEKGEDGTYANAGWPKYVKGILTDEEQAIVEKYNEKHFRWDGRKDKLITVIKSCHADLISLVECDNYESFFLPNLKAAGYAAVYKQRPRKSSADGCAIFYKVGVFSLIASDCFEFVDRLDAKGREVKDRVGLVALLQHSSGRQVIFISTHLARNPEDPKQTSSRAKQTAQLLKGLTDFAQANHALDAPVILAGDLNTTNIQQIANIARVVFELCSEAVHPFIFTASAPRSLPTSVTTTRKMCIDYLFVQVRADCLRMA